MRKQMDRFGLNPSHGISSPWPSSSNLHVFTEEKEQNGGVYVAWGRGAKCFAISTKQIKQDDFKQKASLLCFAIDPACLRWTVLTLASCLYYVALDLSWSCFM